MATGQQPKSTSMTRPTETRRHNSDQRTVFDIDTPVNPDEENTTEYVELSDEGEDTDENTRHVDPSEITLINDNTRIFETSGNAPGASHGSLAIFGRLSKNPWTRRVLWGVVVVALCAAVGLCVGALLSDDKEDTASETAIAHDPYQDIVTDVPRSVSTVEQNVEPIPGLPDDDALARALSDF